MIQLYLNLVFFFALGLLFGSFINMAIYRTRAKKAFTGRSFCDFCKKPLIYKDLIPLFSFIYYKRRSRCCKKKLDKTMPIVELVTALVFSIIYYLLSNIQISYISFAGVLLPFQLIYLLYALSISIILIFVFFYDIKYFEIPFKPIFIGYVLWIIFTVFKILAYKQNLITNISEGSLGKYLLQTNIVNDRTGFFITENILYAFYFAFFVFIFFIFLFLITKGRGMGFGDVYTAPLLALIAGFPAGVIFLFSAFLVGAFYGVITIILKINTVKSRVPFGPFLIIGLITSLLFGNFIVKFYM